MTYEGSRELSRGNIYNRFQARENAQDQVADR